MYIMPKFKKGSQEAKDYMASIRAKKDPRKLGYEIKL